MYSYSRLRSALQDAGPVFTLVLTLGAALWLHLDGSPRGRVFGFAEALPEVVSPIETARVASIEVTVGQEVSAGQIIAKLDTSVIDAEISIAKAQKAQVEADLQMELALLEQELDVDRASIERDLAAQREEQRRAVAEARVLDGEISRIKQLVDDRLAVVGDLTKLDVQHATATAIAGEKPRTLGLLNAQLKAAERRRSELRDRGSGMAAKLDADVRVASESIALLEQRRAGYVLRAANAGRVASIDKQPGEVVPAGEPLVQLLSARTGARAVACVPERSALGLEEGDAAELWIRDQLGASIPGSVVAVGPLVSQLPARCWPTPEIPAWGRVVTIALDTPMALVPGQAFDITFGARRGAAAAAPPKPAPAAPPKPAPAAPPGPPAASAQVLMKVPPALAGRSRLEPSGILARPGESRYLIVSDDTGHERRDEGAPWLFAMSTGGAIEPEPVTVSGVDELSDVEGIAAGDAGEVYLLSSQSYSKKGKRKPERSALLRLRPEGRGFRVDGEIHLAEVLDAAPARAAALGLPGGTRALDVEGLTFRQGALYLGLKAPLDPQGNAMIWRIAAPGALFGDESPAPVTAAGGPKRQRSADEARRFEAARVSLWARARVDVELAGRPAPGGISELLFMPDGSLAVTSTPSTEDGDAGALWRVDRPEAGVLAPRLVQRFPGLKPEGLAPSLAAGALMVVFDAGSAAPSFQELPWGP